MKNHTKDGTLLYKKENCCGCGICAEICPRKAIELKEDDCGFYFPEIDIKRCIGCNLCIKQCAFQSPDKEMQSINSSYAAVNLNKSQRSLSSSAGIFSAVATYALEHGWAVCGAVMSVRENKANIYHKLIDDQINLPLLQGSKYVQSKASDCYKDIRKILQEGNRVLFSGTPCQVAAVKRLFEKYENQLFTIDIICHGTPNNKFFNDYLINLSKKEKKTITDFKFRDKTYGWSLNGVVTFDNLEKKKLPANESSYYRLFLGATIYRESCYKCPYACTRRTGDITIGDYWGAEKYDPEIFSKEGFIKEEGVSCLMVNTNKGKELINALDGKIAVQHIQLEHILIKNTQLRHPVKKSAKRELILELYKIFGYNAVEKIDAVFRRLSTLKKMLKG